MPPAVEGENGQRWGACCPSSRAREASRCEFGPEFGSRDMFQDARAEQSGNEAREGAAAGRKGKRRSRELLLSCQAAASLSSSTPLPCTPRRRRFAAPHAPSGLRVSGEHRGPPNCASTALSSRARGVGALARNRGKMERRKGKKVKRSCSFSPLKRPRKCLLFRFFFSGRFFSPFSLGGRDGVGRGVRETASEG